MTNFSSEPPWRWPRFVTREMDVSPLATGQNKLVVPEISRGTRRLRIQCGTVRILVHYTQLRTRELVALLYNTVSDVAPTPLEGDYTATVVIDESAKDPGFAVNPMERLVFIAGVPTVSRIKVAVRFLRAYCGVSDSRALVPLHGALCQLPQGNLLISGVSGAGKSWVANELRRSVGARLVIDDWALYDTRQCTAERESESDLVVRGDHPAAGAVIEAYGGMDEAPKSRRLRATRQPVPQYQPDCPVAVWVILLDPWHTRCEPFHGDIFRALHDADPPFTDESIALLPKDSLGLVERRLRSFASRVKILAINGHRRQPGSVLIDRILGHL